MTFLRQASGAKIYVSTLPYFRDSQVCHIEGKWSLFIRGLIFSLGALIRWARNLNRFSGFVSPVLYETSLLKAVTVDVYTKPPVPWHGNPLLQRSECI